MRKIILILSVVLLSSVTLNAQNRKGGNRNFQRNNQNRTERFEKRLDNRAENLTNHMARVYELSEEQKGKLLELNKNYLKSNRGERTNKFNDRRNRKHPVDCCVHNPENSKCIEFATPTLQKQYRLNRLTQEVETYQKELKSIFTKKQYKEYEKNLADQLKQFN